VGSFRTPIRAAELLAVALLGAVLALGGAAVLGRLGGGTTIQEVQPAATAGAGDVALGSQSGTALSVAQIYRRSASGVVQITATSVVQPAADPVFGDLFPHLSQTEQALGSGFVIDKAGHIVTNYHVVENAKSVQVSFSDRDKVSARVVGTDPSTDLAVLQVDARSRALAPLPLGNSDNVQVGDPVVAIGNPFGLQRTVTSGIVSALQRELTAPNTYKIEHAIQTDAALNHGNSGGPLLNAEGQVIGVNSQISTGNTGQQGNVGIGFAVPVNTVKNVAAQIIRSGKVEHAFLGIGAQPIDDRLAQLFKLPVSQGLLVQDVQTGSGAARAGLKAGSTNVVVEGESYTLGGDVIVKADGKPVATVGQLRDVVATKRPGDEITLELYRGSKQKTVNVKLGRQPTLPLR